MPDHSASGNQKRSSAILMAGCNRPPRCPSLCPCGGHDESADVCVVIQIDGSELGRFNHFGDYGEWQSWIAELLSPFTDREHVEIHVGDNFRALIRPKLARDRVQCSLRECVD
jgi:hypothetical protein